MLALYFFWHHYWHQGGYICLYNSKTTYNNLKFANDSLITLKLYSSFTWCMSLEISQLKMGHITSCGSFFLCILQSMAQFKWFDGTVKNVHVDPTLLFDYQVCPCLVLLVRNNEITCLITHLVQISSKIKNILQWCVFQKVKMKNSKFAFSWLLGLSYKGLLISEQETTRIENYFNECILRNIFFGN